MQDAPLEKIRPWQTSQALADPPDNQLSQLGATDIVVAHDADRTVPIWQPVCASRKACYLPLDRHQPSIGSGAEIDTHARETIVSPILTESHRRIDQMDFA